MNSLLRQFKKLLNLLFVLCRNCCLLESLETKIYIWAWPLLQIRLSFEQDSSHQNQSHMISITNKKSISTNSYDVYEELFVNTALVKLFRCSVTKCAVRFAWEFALVSIVSCNIFPIPFGRRYVSKFVNSYVVTCSVIYFDRINGHSLSIVTLNSIVLTKIRWVPCTEVSFVRGMYGICIIGFGKSSDFGKVSHMCYLYP